MTDASATPRKPYVPPADRTYSWRLPARPVRRIDADTFVVLVEMPVAIEIGPLNVKTTGKLPHEVILRLDGIDAWEDETAQGKIAAEFVDTWMLSQDLFVLTSNFKRDRYHRVLGQLVAPQLDGLDVVLAQVLLDLGHARRWT